LVVPPLRTRGVGRGNTGVPPGAAPPPACGHGSRWLGSDAPPRNPSRRPPVGHSLRPPRRGAGWISGHWGRCGSGRSETHRHLEIWEPKTWSSSSGDVGAPNRYSSVAGNHGVSVVHPCGRCTVRLVGRDGREFRPSGRLMVAVAQIGSRSTSPPIECTCRWEAAERMGRSCGSMHLALSAELFHRSGGFPPSCR
jgi:hypothetical protein